MKNIVLHIFTFLLLSISFLGCSTEKDKGSPNYINEVRQWDQKRISRLKEETGWLNLVGLFWLNEGNNSFGSANDNDIIFPSGPEHIGNLLLKDSAVTITVLPDVEVLNDGNQVSEMILKDDNSENPTVLQCGSLKWYIIKRTKGFAIRLRDLNAPLVKEFKGIERFPINEDWRIQAKFEKYNPSKKLSVPDITGVVGEELSPGKVSFSVNGNQYSLDAIDAGNKLWFIFADETSGEETYGAGRYLYTDKPDSLGNLIIDFNFAYNPPCVFTKFATCPFPPKENYLKLRVTAGEKMWGENH
jgi:uncharacterized protein (DUF1684 family)